MADKKKKTPGRTEDIEPQLNNLLNPKPEQAKVEDKPIQPFNQAAAESEGNAFIRQREKLASQQGTTSQEAARQLIPGEQAKLQQAQLEQQQLQLREQGIAAIQEAQNRPGPTLPTEAQGFDPLQAGLAGVATAGPSAAGGAALGLVGSAGTLSVPLAVAGALGGFLVGVRSSIKSQISGGITAKGDQKILKSNLLKAVTDINQGGNSVEDVAFFYQNLDQMRINHAQVKADSKTVWALAAGEDATIELEKYENFFKYELPLLENELQQAVLNPNPSKILVTPDEEPQDI